MQGVHLEIVVLLGLAGMTVAMVAFLRRRERRLAARPEIEIPILSFWRSVLVVVLAISVPPLPGIWVVSSIPWLYDRAELAFLFVVAFGGIVIPVVMRWTRSWRRIGVLRATSDRMTLRLHGDEWSIDLARPFELREGCATEPGGVRLQVATFRQDGVEWGFSYGLPIGREPYGNRELDGFVLPLLGAEARVIHERVRDGSRIDRA